MGHFNWPLTAVFCPDLEAVLTRESEWYSQFYSEASDQFGPCGKPIKHKYASRRLASSIVDGVTKETPQTLNSLVRAIDNLDVCTNILQ